MERLTTKGCTYHSLDFMEDGVYEMANKLREYEDLEEQGLLLKLPCKVGYMAYHPSSFWNRVFEYAVISISVDKENIWIKCGNGYSFIFGREIFLTKAEAEKALEEMEK